MTIGFSESGKRWKELTILRYYVPGSIRIEQKNAKKAAALRFDESRNDAPYLVAKGEGSLADQIHALAMEHGIPVIEDPGVADFLQGVKIGQEIPENLYRAVSRIFAFLYSRDQQR